MRYTSEQRIAIETRQRNLIVTAGAGSGKTRVLVERFMALLDAHPDWSLPSIVAITFTEKAAREMRDRVRQAVEQRIQTAVATGDGPGLQRWLDHQANLTRARIGTIHALCARVLRANPAEAALDPAFEVLDENEAGILLDDAVETALAQLVAEDHPAAALLASYGVPVVRRLLRQYAPRGAAGDVAAALPPDPAALLADWERRWQQALHDLMAEIQADRDLADALAAFPEAELPPVDKLADTWRGVLALRPALYGPDPAAWTHAVDAIAGMIKLNVGSAKNWGSKDRLDACKTALSLIRERLQAARARTLPMPGKRDEVAAELLIRWGEAIRLASAVYDQMKRDRNALDFDDLEALTRHLLKDHPPVVARYAREFRHVMVDEFQDTNFAQRDIVYRLAGVGEPGADGRLFVVGDPKQSIYAFRGADVSVFGSVRDDLVAHGGAERSLSTSFRTHEGLVAALNDIFGRILQAGEGPTAAFEVDLGVPMSAHRPISLECAPEQAQPLTVFALQRPDRDHYPDFGADDLRRWEAWTLAHHIHGLVRCGVMVWDRDLPHDDLPEGAVIPDCALDAVRGAYRPIGYGDVTLLFQSMARAPLYEDVFKAAKLPYVTVAGKGYFDRQEVWDLLNLLRALHNPADDLALAVALRSPLFGLSDDALLALRLARWPDGGRMSLWRALFDPGAAPMLPPDEAGACAFARETLGELRDLAGRTPIANLLTHALELTGFQATITGLPDGARRRGNVEKLVRLARASGRVSLGAFNAYARELTAREVREGEVAVEVTRAVTLMSVHASKGLEFPVVVLADASWSRSYRPDPFVLDPIVGAACGLPVDEPDSDEPQPFAWEYARQLAERRDQAERRRLLYVGATRAQDYLIVSGSLARCPESAWLRQWLAALDLTGELEPSDEPAVLDYGWGSCVLHVPRTVTLPGDRAILLPGKGDGWDHPALHCGEPAPGLDAVLPPLLAEVPVEPDAPARALTATHLASLGRAPYYDPRLNGYAAFRHAVLHDSPGPVQALPPREITERHLRRIVGEMVHRALQAWLLPSQHDYVPLANRLRIYAWETGLTHTSQVAEATKTALGLLRKFEASDLRYRLEAARQEGRFFSEVPFVYQAGKRSVHGVIDVVYFDREGQGHVLDYKTAPVSDEAADENARRYFLQVGVYAAAVEARTGAVPQTHLYYVHPGRLVHVRPEDWGAALERLEDDLRSALEVGRE